MKKNSLSASAKKYGAMPAKHGRSVDNSEWQKGVAAGEKKIAAKKKPTASHS